MPPEEPIDENARNSSYVAIGTALFQERLSERSTERQYFLLGLAVITLLLKFGLVEGIKVETEKVMFEFKSALALQYTLGAACAYCTVVYALAAVQDWNQYRLKLQSINPLLTAFIASNTRAFEERKAAWEQRVQGRIARAKEQKGIMLEIEQVRARYANWGADKPIEGRDTRHDDAIIALQTARDAAIGELQAKLITSMEEDAAIAAASADVVRESANDWGNYGDQIVSSLERSTWLGRARAALEVWIPLLFGLAAVLVSIPAIYVWLSLRLPWLSVPSVT